MTNSPACDRPARRGSIFILTAVFLLAICFAEGSPSAIPEAQATDASNRLCNLTPPISVSFILNGDPGPEGDSVLVTLSVTPRDTYHDVRLWLTTEGGINIVGPVEIDYDSLTVGVEETMQATVILTSSGRAILRGGVSLVSEGDSTEIINSGFLYFIVESTTTSWAGGSFYGAAVDSLDFLLETSAIDSAAYVEGLRDLRTADAETTFESETKSQDSNSSTLADFITVSGTILWTDKIGGTHPVRFSPVDVIDEDVAFDDVLATVTTNENGFFSATVETQVADDLDIFVRIWARSDGFYIAPPGERNMPASDNVVTYAAETATQPNVTAGIVINATIGNTSVPGSAFCVLDGLVMGSLYLESLTGSGLSLIPVEFPGSGQVSYYSENPDNHLHYLLGPRFDWDVLHHEFGHFVAYAYGIENNPGGLHGLAENLGETHGKDAGIRIAWGEGWPTYFGTVLQRESSSPSGIPAVGDTRYGGPETGTRFYDLESDAWSDGVLMSTGEDNELAVQRILWDLYDSNDDIGDSVTLGDVAMWNIMVGANPTTLSDAWNALIYGQDRKTITTYGKIFAYHNVAPDPTQPADELQLAPGDAPPTFKWDPNGAGPSNRLNKFQVRFWSDDLSLVLLDSPELSVPEFTPSQQFIEYLFANRSTVRWFVKGWNTNSPETGTYFSPARSLIYGVDVAFIIDDTGSMDEELVGVRDALLNHLGTYGNDSTRVFQLTTFKDWVEERNPTDLTTVQGQVATLIAEGGFDCPESSVDAILQVQDGIKDNTGRVFFATDADPHPESDLPAAIAALRSRGIRFDAIVSGSCEEFESPTYTGVSDNETATNAKPAAKPVLAGLVESSRLDLTPLPLGQDDFIEVALPFSFPFRGEVYTSAFVSANGHLTFEEGDGAPFPDEGAFQTGPPRIAGLWTALRPNYGGQISAGAVGSEFHVVYDSIPIFFSSYRATFTIILRDDGSFSVAYTSINPPPIDMLCGATPGFLQDSITTEIDLSATAEPIDGPQFGTAFELFEDEDFDLNGVQLDFAPVTYIPAPLPVEYSAYEAFSLLARETGGIFAFIPEVNDGTPESAQRYQNTIFNIVQGGLTNSIALANPPFGPQGSTLTVRLTGSSTNFRSNTAVSFDGSGINITDTDVISPTELDVSVSIDPGTALGFRDVTAETNLSGEIETAVGVGAFEIIAPLVNPTILSVSPGTGLSAQQLKARVYGMATNFDATSIVTMGSGITIDSIAAIAATILDAYISIDSAAAAGPRDITVQTGVELADEPFTGPFFVVKPSSEESQLVNIWPQSASPGTDFSISIVGNNTNFVDGISVVSFSDSSVVVENTVVADLEHLTADVQAGVGTLPGFQDVRVQTGSETVVLLDAFLILELSCGDVNGSGNIDIADAVFLINYIFASGPAPVPGTSDFSCDGSTDIADVVWLVNYIFAGGPAPCALCK